MTAREQDYQKLHGILSVKFGNNHIEVLKDKIKNLQNEQKEVKQKTDDAYALEIKPQELSSVAGKAPIIGAVAGLFLALQFFGHFIMILLPAAVVGIVLGFIIGIVVKKSKQSSLKLAYQNALTEKESKIKNGEARLAEIKETITSVQKELKTTQGDVAILKSTYLKDIESQSFVNQHGLDSVEMLILYFDRGRADTISEAIELYKDEAKDKARIERAMDEINRSTAAYINAYMDTLKRLGRSVDYKHIENSAERYNERLAEENKEMREIINNPKK